MTRRERLEAKLAKRAEWAEKADARSDAASRTAYGLVKDIPMGQPILVGHHSEKRHRRVLERADNAMGRAVAEGELASHHRSKAVGLEHQLDRSIFSDDPDAVEALQDRLAELEAERAQMKAANAWWRKHKSMKGYATLTDAQAARLDAEIPLRYSWEQQPYAPYQLSNLGGRIQAARKRVADVQARQQRQAAAAAAPGGIHIEGGDYIRVTFPEKPARATLDALKAAGFHWSGGGWCGERVKLPAEVQP